MKLIEEVKKFLNFKKKKQRKEVEKLRRIVSGLSIKADGLKKRWEKQKKGEKRKEYEKEYRAVKKLLKKSEKRLFTIIEANKNK